MRSIVAASLVTMSLMIPAVVAAANGTTLVTNPTPAVSATMTLTGSDASCFYWTVSGKVKPAYRGHGANVKLVCERYDAFGRDAGLVFPSTQCDGPECPTNVDACGNFSFAAQVCGTSPQLDPTNVCVFVVHVDDSKQPQACGANPPPAGDSPEDPNGSAPCSGGLCPTSP